MNEKELKAWEASRDLGAELLQSVAEMKAGKAAREHKVPVSPVTEARLRVGLSQEEFARLLGVSRRTLQQWENTRRIPRGAVGVVLKIAARHPEVLREMASEA